MGKDAYDKLKIISDIVKDNKVLIIWVLGTLISSSGAGAYFVQSAKEEGNKAVQQVATAFQAQIAEKEIPAEVTLTQQPDGSWKTEVKRLDQKIDTFKKRYDHNMQEYHGVK